MKYLYKQILLYIILLISAFTSAQEVTPYYYEIDSGLEVLGITNREFTTNNNQFFFSNEVDTTGKLSFFHAVNHSIDSISMTKFSKSEFSDFIKNKKGNWLVFVHGDFKTMEIGLMRGMDIANTYGINVIVFSWPSKDNEIKGLKNYKKSKANLVKSGESFVKFLKLIKELESKNAIKKDSISGFFHSLGNRYLEEIVVNNNKQTKVFNNVILNSAAATSKGHNVWLSKLEIQNHIYVLYNDHDFTLRGLRFFTSEKKQLGEDIPDKLSDNTTYIDFSENVGKQFPTWNTHSFYIGDIPRENKKLFDIYNMILHSKQPDLQDTSLFIKTDKANRFIVKEN
jgi:esterase/lipase superfamily enzyme